jgi:hypothetical protein
MNQRRLIAVVAISSSVAIWPTALTAQEAKPNARSSATSDMVPKADGTSAEVLVKKIGTKGLACTEPGICGRCDCPPDTLPAAKSDTDESEKKPK